MNGDNIMTRDKQDTRLFCNYFHNLRFCFVGIKIAMLSDLLIAGPIFGGYSVSIKDYSAPFCSSDECLSCNYLLIMLLPVADPEGGGAQ